MDNEKDPGWLRFAQFKPNNSVYFHQAATLLFSMDESMRCSLCGQVFRVPVSLQPCNHSFCNECIRKKLGISEDGTVPEGVTLRCPTCHTPLEPASDLSKCIVHNRNFEETTRHYRALCPVLKKALEMPHRPHAILDQDDDKKSAPRSRSRAPRKSGNVEGEGEGDGDARKSTGGTRGRQITNPWIREQFVVEWTEDKETWSFICIHCQQVAARSRDKIWNASILTGHILGKCPAASEELKAKALSYTRVARKKRKQDLLEEMEGPPPMHVVQQRQDGDDQRGSRGRGRGDEDSYNAPYM